MHNWIWEVIYDDGTEIIESDEAPFSSLDMDKIQVLIITNTETQQQFAVHYSETMRPIFFRRMRRLLINDPNTIPEEYVNDDGSLKEMIVKTIAFGWQSTVNGKNVKSLAWILEDGSVAFTDKDIDEF